MSKFLTPASSFMKVSPGMRKTSPFNRLVREINSRLSYAGNAPTFEIQEHDNKCNSISTELQLSKITLNSLLGSGFTAII